MLNRDELTALARGTVCSVAGLALLGAIWWVSRWALGVVVVVGLVVAAWDACRHPWWRLWR